jgi:hypothetical protein
LHALASTSQESAFGWIILFCLISCTGVSPSYGQGEKCWCCTALCGPDL